MKVIIGNYFPAGQLLGLTDASESDMIQKAENDLEGAYTVKVGQLSDIKDSKGIEFVIRKKV